MRLWAEKLIFLTICVTLTSLCKISIFTTNYVMNAGCLHIRYGLTNIRIGLHDWHGVTTCELIRIFITSFSTGVFFCICDTDDITWLVSASAAYTGYQPSRADADPYHTHCETPLHFCRFGICACLQTKDETFFTVDIFKCRWKLQMLVNVTF